MSTEIFFRRCIDAFAAVVVNGFVRSTTITVPEVTVVSAGIDRWDGDLMTKRKHAGCIYNVTSETIVGARFYGLF